MIGKRFAHYEILEKLGVGGMGVVYRARDLQLVRDVAVKFLPSRFAADPDRLARFNREARSASALNHPSIVTIHQVGVDDGLPYIVMEFVQGASLRDLVRERPLPVGQVLELGAQIADGLAKAHAAGIVHRDLKPENVVVTPDGLAKILDFGLAKANAFDAGSGDNEGNTKSLRIELQSEREALSSAATDPGVVLGTAGYMSPEQAAGRPLDFRSDQFSFGSLLYEMACGQRAFERPTVVQTMASILDDEPAPVGTLNPAVPAPLRWVIARCLSKDPRQRYESTQDLARELKTMRDNMGALSGSGPVLARQFGPVMLARRHAAALAAGLGLLVVLSGAYTMRARWLGLLGLEPLPRERHLVVLPFGSDAKDERGRAFSDGLVDTVTSRLAQMVTHDGSLWVVPSDEVRRSGVTTAGAARRAFGVTLAVAGQLQHAGERLRLDAQVVDTRAERTLRSLTLSTPSAQPADLEEQALSRLAGLLDAEPSPGLRRPAPSLPVAPTAYQMYTQGRGHLQRYEDPAQLERAISDFQSAATIDQNYALAYAGMGEAYWRSYEQTHKQEFVRYANDACQRALTLNNLLSQVHVTLGMLNLGSGKAQEALADFEHALALDPHNADAVLQHARALARTERFDEAEAEYQRAIALQPGYWYGHNHLAAYLMDRGRYAEAVAEFESAQRLTPDNVRVLNNLGGAYQLMGRYDAAETALRGSLHLRPSAVGASNLATLLFTVGRYAEAASTLEEAVRLNAEDYRLWYNLASARYWATEQRESTRDVYERAAALAERQLEINAHDGPLLAKLADCYAMLGRNGDARRRAEQALREMPDSPAVLYRTGVALERLGDRTRAMQLVASALARGYSHAEVDRAPGLRDLRADTRFGKIVESSQHSSHTGGHE